jgi:DNA-binding response OmpR family regulator
MEPTLIPQISPGKIPNPERSMTMADKRRILCIEDEPEMIDLIRLILERKGFEVLGAVGGQEGLEAIRREKPDLVLLDLMMPDVDGWEVYRQMKADEELQHTPVVVVTAKAQSIDKVLGLHIAKVDDYVTKPFGPGDLAESVERVLQKKKEGVSE